MNFKKEKVINLSLDKVNNKLSNSKKTALIAEHFKSIMELLELDMTDNSLKDTPIRVAKMYVEELFEGLNPANKPVVTNFENSFNYRGMILEKNINLYSICEDGKKYGEFEISENKAFELPDKFMNLIGKHSSSLSFPGKPSLD